jgi:hypothetical protein
MACSGMVRRVTFVRTDVSEERSASFITVTRIGELGTTILVLLMMEAVRSPDTSVLTKATRRNMPEDAILHSHHRENVKSYRTFFTLSGFELRLLCDTPRPMLIVMYRSRGSLRAHFKIGAVYFCSPRVQCLFRRKSRGD